MKKTAVQIITAVVCVAVLVGMVPMAAATEAADTVLMPEASGVDVFAGGGATIDASNAADGYIMVRCLSKGSKLKVIIKGPSSAQYVYNLNSDDVYETFPLSDGNGKYTIGVYKNISGTKYSTVYSKTLEIKLTDEFAPYLRPNQYVNFNEDSQVVSLAAQLTANCGTELEKVQAIYHYVVNNLTYDYDKAATVASGYLPYVDKVMSEKKGICFDYAAVMAAMLRSRGIPTKLVVGYAGTAYHAWISVYTEDSGWIEGVIFFDGSQWKLMDPTFASTGKSSRTTMEYIGNTANYSVKYLY